MRLKARDGDRTRDVQPGKLVQLRTKNNSAYGLHFESMNSPISSRSSFIPSLNDVEPCDVRTRLLSKLTFLCRKTPLEGS